VRRSNGLLAALLATLPAAACIEVENPSVCTTQTEQISTPPLGGSLSQDIPVDIGQNLPVSDFDLSVWVEQLVVSTTEPGGNFNGMTSASWSIVPSTGSPVPIASYTKTTDPGTRVAFTIPASKPDLGQYILSGSTVFRFQYSGSFPVSPMNTQFNICMSIRAKKNVL
jgi:hypothetical protein